jgi:hypothetical protein
MQNNVVVLPVQLGIRLSWDWSGRREAAVAAKVFVERFAELVQLVPNAFGCLWLTGRACSGESSPLVEALAGADASVDEAVLFAQLAHERAFQIWLNLTLCEQYTELTQFLHDHSMSRAELLGLLRDRRITRALTP